MNKILKKISAAVQMLLMAPVKLPGKAMHVIRYIALGLGILEAVVSDSEASSGQVNGEKEVNGDEAEP